MGPAVQRPGRDAVTDAALLEAVRAIVREELRAALRPDIEPEPSPVFEAVAQLYGPGDAFTADDVLDAARFDAEARELLREHCGASVQRIGVALGKLADTRAVAAGVRVVRLAKKGNVRRWRLQGVRSP